MPTGTSPPSGTTSTGSPGWMTGAGTTTPTTTSSSCANYPPGSGGCWRSAAGGGAGPSPRLLAPRAEHVLGLDLSPEMVRLAGERSPGQTNLDYEVADVMQ